jgi:hypothetical protein
MYVAEIWRYPVKSMAGSGSNVWRPGRWASMGPDRSRRGCAEHRDRAHIPSCSIPRVSGRSRRALDGDHGQAGVRASVGNRRPGCAAGPGRKARRFDILPLCRD